ncbi:MAG: hypothetical protein DCO96_03225 [Fluviicola sp. XM-24bin1]|nr:MAG: hypothetical protein DCO96_03225 [Fluviicola sp. XM-24bin1]
MKQSKSPLREPQCTNSSKGQKVKKSNDQTVHLNKSLVSHYKTISGTLSGTTKSPSVAATISSTLTPGARSIKWN